ELAATISFIRADVVQALGVDVKAMPQALEAFLRIVPLMGLCVLAPNTQTIVGRYMRIDSPESQRRQSTRLEFSPSIGWAVVVGAMFAASVTQMVGSGEFLYF